jgi:hypothetical protein
MIRVLIAAFLIVLIVLVAVQVLREARKSKVDWTGLGFIGVFVLAAFWLRDLTGLG